MIERRTRVRGTSRTLTPSRHAACPTDQPARFRWLSSRRPGAEAFGQPILVASGVESSLGSWTIDTFGESLVYLSISILFLLVGPRLLVGWGGLARFATATLAVIEPEELKRANGDVLARVDRADAFEIMDQLQLRLGRGPFLTPTRLEPTLLALESNGLVTARREGPPDDVRAREHRLVDTEGGAVRDDVALYR